MEHIRPNLGNLLLITSVSALGIVTGLAAMHYLSKRDVPALSSTARGLNDFIHKATTPARSAA